jgi:hypothetical protein
LPSGRIIPASSCRRSRKDLTGAVAHSRPTLRGSLLGTTGIFSGKCIQYMRKRRCGRWCGPRCEKATPLRSGCAKPTDLSEVAGLPNEGSRYIGLLVVASIVLTPGFLVTQERAPLQPKPELNTGAPRPNKANFAPAGYWSRSKTRHWPIPLRPSTAGTTVVWKRRSLIPG